MRSLLQRSRAAIMGVVNVTPDSFSDGGDFLSPEAARQHALNLIAQGADILDIGGESSRPGAQQVPLQQELDRVMPVIEGLVRTCDTPISIDSYKPEVMEAAVKAGASMVNDITALRTEGAVETVTSLAVPVCLMHMQATPDTMQQAPYYDDVVSDVLEFLAERIAVCLEAGVPLTDIVIDPGIGFGKTLEHNLALLAAIAKIKTQLECEVLVGVSRKSMIAQLLDREVNQRLPASLGLAVQSVLNGAKIVRVHDVRETVDAVRAVEAVAAYS